MIPLIDDQDPGTTRVLLDEDGERIEKTVLANGMRVLTQHMPSARSATIGVWVPVGSRDETDANRGASHFLEHLLFKGTQRRTALEISSEIDAVGGDLNAFTSKEATCFYARVLDRDVPIALDVLLDMTFHSRLSESDVEAERAVVVEEIAMNDDDPSGVAHELFTEMVFHDTTLAAPITGTVDDMQRMTHQTVVDHYRRWYIPENIAVVAAGGISHRQVLGEVAAAFDPQPAPPSMARRVRETPPLLRPARRVSHRGIEQANIVLGFPSMSRTDPRRYALAVLNAALGGGMSSRLFQEVREQRGLAYSVQSFTQLYSDLGSYGVYAGTLPAKAEFTIELVQEILADVRQHGISYHEVERGRGQTRGGLALSAEQSSSRMVKLGESETVTGQLVPISSAIAAIDAVTVDDVCAIAEEILSGAVQISVVGPFNNDH